MLENLWKVFCYYLIPFMTAERESFNSECLKQF